MTSPETIAEPAEVFVPGRSVSSARWTWQPDRPWDVALSVVDRRHVMVRVELARVALRWACMGAHAPDTATEVVVSRYPDGSVLRIDTVSGWLLADVESARRFLQRTRAVVDMCPLWWQCGTCDECRMISESVESMTGEE